MFSNRLKSVALSQRLPGTLSLFFASFPPWCPLHDFRKDEAAAMYLRCAEMWVQADEAGVVLPFFYPL